MASSGRKIVLFDPSGMLTKEVLLGYIYNELPPAVRVEVEQYIAGNEMYQDMIEGIKLISDRVQAEKIINSLNEEVAERTGSVASVPGLGENVGEFFWNYRRVAAVVGATLLLSAAVLTVALFKVSDKDSGIALKNEPEKTTTQTTEPETIPAQQLPAGNTFTPATDSFIQQPIAERDEDSEIQQKEPSIGTTTSPGVFNGISSQWHANGGALEKKKEKKVMSDSTAVAVTGATQTKTTVTVPDENLAMDDKAPQQDISNKNERDEAAGEEVVVVAESKVKKNDIATMQQQEIAKNDYFVTPEVMPEFPGGEAALKQYLHDNLKYPEKSKADGAQGNVNINFTVGTAGRIKDIVVISGVNKEINTEAIRLIAAMPKWKPGMQKGKAVPVKQSLTIEFKIE